MKKIIFSLIFTILFTTASFASEFFPNITMTGVDGPWMDVRAYSSLNACVAAVPALTPRTILISDPGILTTGNLTIPSHVTLVLTQYGLIDNTGGHEITFQNPNPIIAPNRRLHIGGGDLDFAVGTIVKSSWFDDLDQALTMLADDTVTLVITESETLTNNCAVPATVTLRWESPFILTSTGDNLTGLKKIEAGTYQIFSGTAADDFDFLAGSVVHSSWFQDLNDVIEWTSDENVDLTILVDQPETIDFNVTADIHQEIEIKKGCSVSVDALQTLTIYSPGHVRATSRQIAFIGDGATAFTVGGTVYPEWFWDGDTDWHDEIETATTSLANNGGAVQLDERTYTVELTTTDWIRVPSYVTIRGLGHSSIVKVADNNPDYRTIFGANGVEATNTYGIKYLDFKIDQNINSVTGTPATGGATDQFAIYHAPTSGADFEVSGMYIACGGINAVVINSADLSFADVHDNTFYFTEQTGEEYDNTPIYVHAKYATIHNNMIVSDAIGDGNSGLEIHGGPGSITGNVIDKFFTGIHIVAESPTEAERDNQITCTGNSISGANSGIFLWGIGTAPTRELSNVTVTGNVIQLSQVDHLYTYSSFGIACYIDVTNRGDIRNVAIGANTITFQDEGVGRGVTYDRNFSGIFIAGIGNMYNFTITGNTIVNAPGPGIYLGNSVEGGSVLDGARVSDNLIVNAGQNIGIGDYHRTSIVLNGFTSSTLTRILVVNNQGYDTWNPTRAVHSAYAFTGGTISECEVKDNVFYASHGTLAFVVPRDFTRWYVHAADYTIKSSEDGAIFTNEGSAGLITFTLPPTIVAGLTYTFYAHIGNDIHIDPFATEGIAGANAPGDYLILDGAYETVTLVSTYGGWIVKSYAFWDETFEP